MATNRTLRIQKIKGVDDAFFNISEGLDVFIGKNGSGKSTAIQCIETAIMTKGFLKSPVMNGEKEGKIEYNGNDISGNPIKIIVDIAEDNTYSFTAGIIVNNKLKTITDPKKIRDLMGTYFQLTVEEVLAMIKYSDGRREFIQKYLLPLFTETQRKRLDELQLSVSDKKTKAAEGNLYNRRTLLNKEIETLNIQISGAKLTDEEKVALTQKQAVVDYLDELEKEYKEHSQDGGKFAQIKAQVERLERTLSDISNGVNTLSNEFELDLSKEMRAIDFVAGARDYQLLEEQKNLYSNEKIAELSQTIERGRTKKIYIESLEKKSEPTELITQRDKKFNEVFEIEKQITDNKNEIKAIYSASNLPSGLSIDEETIYLDGMLMDETVTSNTQSRISIVELLCNLSTCEFVHIGDLSLYDTENKKKLIELAKKHNRIMLGSLVSDDVKVTLQTIIA